MLSIAEYAALFNLIGTTYGGNGQSTFGLPDLRGRIPIHVGTDTSGNSYVQGQQGGTEQVTLTLNQIPQHTHVPQAQSAGGNLQGPAGGFWSASNLDQFSTTAPNGTMNPAAISATGASSPLPHENRMPYLAINFIISLFGIYPSQG